MNIFEKEELLLSITCSRVFPETHYDDFYRGKTITHTLCTRFKKKYREGVFAFAKFLSGEDDNNYFDIDKFSNFHSNPILGGSNFWSTRLGVESSFQLFPSIPLNDGRISPNRMDSVAIKQIGKDGIATEILYERILNSKSNGNELEWNITAMKANMKKKTTGWGTKTK